MDWISAIAKEMPIEELPEEFQSLAEEVGVEGILRLSEHLGGMSIYVPKIDRLVRKRRDERIRSEFNGANYRELANKYKRTETWIRQIIKNKGN